jgi:hypothetical protein
MPLLAHPSTIPGPTAFEAEPRERRALSADETGAQQTRGRETDFNGSGVLQYEYTQAQLKIFRTWGKGDLAEWSRWFSVVLPGYGGFTAHIVRFKQPPKWDHVGFSEETKGYWVVSAEVEVRGRGVAPERLATPIEWDDAASFAGWAVTGATATLGVAGNNSNPYPPRNLFGNRYAGGSGKRYFEISIGADDSSAVEPGYIGFVNAAGRVHLVDYSGYVLTKEAAPVADDPAAVNELGNAPYSGGPPNWGVSSSVASPITVRFAINFDTGEVWIGMGNSWYGADPAAGTFPVFDNASGAIRPYVAYFANSPDVVVTLCASEAEFTQAMPSGFEALGLT